MLEDVPRHGKDMAPADMLERIGRDDPLILECGCHDGKDTLKFLEAFPNCRIHCFEPDSRPIERIDPPGFYATIGADQRVILNRSAVSDEDGIVKMYRSSGTAPNGKWGDDWDHSGSILRPTGHLDYSPWCTFPDSHQIYVHAIRLDTWLRRQSWREHMGIDFIWADVQGAQGMMIQGAPATLKRTRWLYTEFTPDHKDELYSGEARRAEIEALLPGWELVAIYTENLLFRNCAFGGVTV